MSIKREMCMNSSGIQKACSSLQDPEDLENHSFYQQ